MPHEAAAPFAHTSGPQSARVVFCGEAWGAQEDVQKRPLCGETGREFWRMLGEAYPEISPQDWTMANMCRRPEDFIATREHWLEAAGFLLTNTLAFRPPANQLMALCGGKKDLPAGYKWKSIKQGKYILPEYIEPEVERLKKEIEQANPNLCIAMGNLACLALLNSTGITSIRGTFVESSLLPGLKVLPTFHPAYILREWPDRPIVLADLLKAKDDWAFPEVRRPARTVLTNPSLFDIESFLPRLLNAELISVDIETFKKQISMIGFAASRSEALVIPFIDKKSESRSYWSTQEDEITAWSYVQQILAAPGRKLFQNGLFDLQYLMRAGLRVQNAVEDTMLLHHSMYPEMRKSLGFLGSIYTKEPAWKLMRGREAEELKRDE